MANHGGHGQAPPQDAILLSQFATAAWQRLGSLVSQRLPVNQQDRYDRGSWSFAYQLNGAAKRVSAGSLLEMLRSVPAVTGWAPWHVFARDELKPYSADGTIECWAIEATSNDDGDFWRAAPSGLFFLARRLQEDRLSNVAPGTVLDAELPCWRTAECLLHAIWIAKSLGATGMIVEATWRGLRGRHLDHATAETRFRYPPVSDYKCRLENVESKASIDVSSCETSLTDTVLDLTRPLYEAFDFYEMPRAIADAEIVSMRRGR